MLKPKTWQSLKTQWAFYLIKLSPLVDRIRTTSSVQHTKLSSGLFFPLHRGRFIEIKKLFSFADDAASLPGSSPYFYRPSFSSWPLSRRDQATLSSGSHQQHQHLTFACRASHVAQTTTTSSWTHSHFSPRRSHRGRHPTLIRHWLFHRLFLKYDSIKSMF